MTRLRRAATLAACALVAVLLVALAVADPFHLRHAAWFVAGLVVLAVLLGTAALAVAVPRGVARVLVLVLGAIAVCGWAVLVTIAQQFGDGEREVSEVADGGHRLVVIEGSPFAIDPVYAVVVRAGSGPFEQESIVYQGVEEAPPPSELRFVDGDTVEVQTSGGCRFRSEVESVTLAVDPVHRPLRADGC